jgi:hypothetical protein
MQTQQTLADQKPALELALALAQTLTADSFERKYMMRVVATVTNR